MICIAKRNYREFSFSLIKYTDLCLVIIRCHICSMIMFEGLKILYYAIFWIIDRINEKKKNKHENQ
jgi:hypothetical protein